MHKYCVGQAGCTYTAVLFWASSTEIIEQNLEAEKRGRNGVFGLKKAGKKGENVTY